MGILDYSFLCLLVSLIFSIIVRLSANEKYQILYCLVSPIFYGLIFASLPYFFTDLGDQIFHRPNKSADCGNIFVAVFMFQVFHFAAMTPIVIMATYALNLIILKGKFKKRKTNYPNDVIKDKW
jgi:hypothetical protein